MHVISPQFIYLYTNHKTEHPLPIPAEIKEAFM